MRNLKFGVLVIVAAAVLAGCSVAAKQPVPFEETTYEVVTGDTLQKVSARFGIPARAIQTFNGLGESRDLQVGQRLRIPSLGPIDQGSRYSKSVNTKEAKVSNKPTGPRMVSVAGVRQYLKSLKVPVDTARYSSQFGWRWGRFHEGIDLASSRGSKVRAAHDGTVVFVSESYGRYGRMVVVRGENLITVYTHNERNRATVGDIVKTGDWIADVGASGNATGPHLHLETRVLDDSGRWAAVDPAIFFKSGF
jgi:murein DD-endopeptidase MepM/ murein hydrolase activator NlpD